jgi:hypothetical protein
LKGQLSVNIPDTENIILVLKGVEIYCGVAPGIIFYNANEMDKTNYKSDKTQIEFNKAIKLNPDDIGIQVIIADDSDNTVSGSHVAKFNDDKGKKVKYDGAFYSKVSLLITGDTKGNGRLNIIGDNEGLDSEKHLIISGGNINIASQDDGINANHDGGSVILINGGNVKVNGGLNTGDGIDSNGYLIIQNGTVISQGNPGFKGISADLGIVINGGTVIGVGSILTYINNESEQQIIHLRFSSEIPKNSKLSLKDLSGKTLLSFNPSTSRFISGTDTRKYTGAVISHPSIKQNEVYYLYLGNTQLHIQPGDEKNSQIKQMTPSEIESVPTYLKLNSKFSTFDVYNSKIESSGSKIEFSLIYLFAFLIILF